MCVFVKEDLYASFFSFSSIVLSLSLIWFLTKIISSSFPTPSIKLLCCDTIEEDNVYILGKIVEV